MKKNIVIFSGSNKPKYYDDIEKDLILLSNKINVDKYNLYYGGGESGLMGVIPYHFHKRNGNVYGIDAKQFVDKYGKASFGETYIMDTFIERQNTLISKGDIFLCLPGGIGTISELFDVLVNNDVNGKNNKVILFSYNNFFEDIVKFIYKKIDENFIRVKILNNLVICKYIEEVIKELLVNE